MNDSGTISGRSSFGRIALITVPVIVVLGLLSGRASNSGYGNRWFDALQKPDFMPPGWAFGAAWTLLYILMGVAFAMILARPRTAARQRAITLFVAQLIVNLVWSPLFFAAHQVTAAFWWIMLLIALVIATVVAFRRVKPMAGWLMLPYLAWLIFAATLNFAVDRLNPDAETLVNQAASAQIAV